MWPFKKKKKAKINKPPRPKTCIRDYIFKIGESISSREGWVIRRRGNESYSYVHAKCGIHIIHPLKSSWILLYVNSRLMLTTKQEEKYLSRILRPISKTLEKDVKGQLHAEQKHLRERVLECKDL